MNKTPEDLTQKFATKLGKMMSLIPIIIFQTTNFICLVDLCNLEEFEILNLADLFKLHLKFCFWWWIFFSNQSTDSTWALFDIFRWFYTLIFIVQVKMKNPLKALEMTVFHVIIRVCQSCISVECFTVSGLSKVTGYFCHHDICH